jgi:hypothetical protein
MSSANVSLSECKKTTFAWVFEQVVTLYVYIIGQSGLELVETQTSEIGSYYMMGILCKNKVPASAASSGGASAASSGGPKKLYRMKTIMDIYIAISSNGNRYVYPQKHEESWFETESEDDLYITYEKLQLTMEELKAFNQLMKRQLIIHHQNRKKDLLEVLRQNHQKELRKLSSDLDELHSSQKMGMDAFHQSQEQQLERMTQRGENPHSTKRRRTSSGAASAADASDDDDASVEAVSSASVEAASAAAASDDEISNILLELSKQK